MNSIFKSINYHFHPNNHVPDMEFHYSILANYLSTEIYKQYFNVKTKSGFTMQKCIQPGVENPGTQSNFTIGVVAGDVSFGTFSEDNKPSDSDPCLLKHPVYYLSESNCLKLRCQKKIFLKSLFIIIKV